MACSKESRKREISKDWLRLWGTWWLLKSDRAAPIEMFWAFKAKAIELLKTYGQELPETVFEQLEVSAKFMFS